MATKSISTSEPPAATPVAVVLEIATADKLLFTRMQAFVSLPVVLAGKCFTADTANKWTLIGVSAQMRTQVVGSCEAFRAQITLESGWVLLRALWVGAITGIAGS